MQMIDIASSFRCVNEVTRSLNENRMGRSCTRRVNGITSDENHFLGQLRFFT